MSEMAALGDMFAERALVIVGAGKMGSALLERWLANGLPHNRLFIIEPNPSPHLLALQKRGARLNALPENPMPLFCVLAIKPQNMMGALEQVVQFSGADTCFISIAAGISLFDLEKALVPQTPLIRAMPNMPAVIGRGITALIGNSYALRQHLDMAERLLSVVGKTIMLDEESSMDAVTALSGSGPAYVFHLIEAMIEAGEALGLSHNIATELTLATVAGAGLLAFDAGQTPAALRESITSAGGTTAAALVHLMDKEKGFAPLLKSAIARACARSKELSHAR